MGSRCVGCACWLRLSPKKTFWREGSDSTGWRGGKKRGLACSLDCFMKRRKTPSIEGKTIANHPSREEATGENMLQNVSAADGASGASAAFLSVSWYQIL